MQQREIMRGEAASQSAAARGTEQAWPSQESGGRAGEKPPAVNSGAAGEALRVCCIRTEDALEALAPHWDLLDQAQAPRTPFTSPAWNVSWWRHLRSTGLLAKDSLCVYALYDPDGVLVAIAPMLITSRPGKGALCLRELRFFGADANITELRGLVCAPRDYDRSLAAVLRMATPSSRQWHLATWSGLRRPPAEWNAAEPPLVWRRQISDFCLTLPASWSAFRDTLPRNARESIRKCYNSLKRDGHEAGLRVVTEPARVADALDLFFRLHRERARAVGTIEHADVFRDRKTRRFLREYASYSVARGELRIFQLFVGETVIATRVGFLLDRELYLYYSGYDPAWARYSAMTTCVIEILKWAIANEVSVVNLSTGEDTSKTRWRPTKIAYHDAVQRSGTVAWRTGFAAGESIFLALRGGQRTVRRWIEGALARLVPRS